jgi:uncharacterized protein (DUF1684 family)
VRRHLALVALLALTGCARHTWPDPPAVDRAQYQKDYDAWREDQRQGLSQVLPIVGIWTVNEGETPFGSDSALPIVLPAAHFAARAGVVRRKGGDVTIVPEPKAGPVQLIVTSGGDDRRWLMAVDESHPAVKNPPMLDAYPLDSQWRVAARFDAFEKPRKVRVPDVRGGEMEFTAPGQLVFRISGEEMRLTAFAESNGPEFFVMFKDPTNQTTTFRGYRILSPKVVKDDEWTVIDFNFAMNPPCAYSKYTTCPLPPPENTLPVAIEAGLKRLASAQGYSE